MRNGSEPAVGRVVVNGGGMCGLLTATLLARAGHDVTVLERDEMEPPTDPDEAWARWLRKGVNQFRLLHYLQPRFRAEISQHLPELVDALTDAGAAEYNTFAQSRLGREQGTQAGDERFTALTGRRPVIESAAARVAVATPGLSVRRGATVEGLVADSGNGIPRVSGVRLVGGEVVPAGLVVDATGRRSQLPAWLEAIGARPVEEELEDLGFVYYGRHFRSPARELPWLEGGLLTNFGTVSTLTLPADNGTWGLGIIASAADREMRVLKDPQRWMALWGGLPGVGHWLDGECITDGVDVMARIPDRHRSLVVDGEPVATGVVAVADSWACTNPSVGRGITIGLLHALVDARVNDSDVF
jgi:2-polyprenyl-6-methoxyphenol hydroxylase-like FAD-dependent oxidoreductase